MDRGFELNVILMHHPVVDKEQRIITTSLTHLDVHDIARSCRTFGVNKYYIAHPSPLMRKIGQNIVGHWLNSGVQYQENRAEALGRIEIVDSLDMALLKSGPCRIVTTSAIDGEDRVTFPEMSSTIKNSKEKFMLVFGTGWGLAPEVLQRADYFLEPIAGVDGYNHLSVRAAVAIILSRLV